MKRLARFLTLPAAERGLLFSALGTLLLLRLGLWLLPLPRLLARLQRRTVAKAFRGQVPPPPPTRIAWAVRAASRFVPGGGNCLLQSLAGQHLLTRRGYLSHLRIGVAKESDGPLRAHAWVEWDGRILIGGVGPTHFTPFPPLEVRHP
ncbi:MAG: lasso peptide biosynthesis B2 protein [Caldilineaceae bacterium]|nr:lasso peptide biosynthesis B2 protein [Caldilineaceae bacterium]